MDVSSDEEEFEISEVQVLARKETIIKIKKAEKTNVKTTA